MTGATATERESAPTVLLDQRAIAARVERIAGRITADHPDGVVLVGVLKGALVFLADLARAITEIDVTVDFLAISRYAPDSGRVRILKDLDVDVEGRDVVLVEDLVDTGLTLAYLVSHVRERAPRSLDVCTLLDRSVRRIVPLTARYVGEEIGDVFVLGYGLHHVDLYRNVPYIVEADRRVVLDRPAAYVDFLYGSAAVPRDGGSRRAVREGGW
ncbi:MAG TPA: hypoxanthine phosphoribosyltransferase [Acidimicrobiia bacterium]|nr:hypoxanthine phosphoribosyltransferase [Acidimicrobiia bacterium]